MKRLGMVVVILAGLVLTFGCTQFKDVGRTIGHAARDTTRAIGHASRDIATAISDDIDASVEENNK